LLETKGDNQMIKLIAKTQAFWMDRSGATAIEYGLIAGGISLAIVAAVFAFGGSLSGMFDKLATTMSDAANQGSSSSSGSGG
jgi:pilus assembly protein Flp/PilA